MNKIKFNQNRKKRRPSVPDKIQPYFKGREYAQLVTTLAIAVMSYQDITR
jgi:hypothetical protein